MSIELLFQELCDKVEWDEELKYYFVTELNGSYHVELLTSKSEIAAMKAQTSQVRGFVSKNLLIANLRNQSHCTSKEVYYINDLKIRLEGKPAVLCALRKQ